MIILTFIVLWWRMELTLTLQIAMFLGQCRNRGEHLACLVMVIGCHFWENLTLDVIWSWSWVTFPPMDLLLSESTGLLCQRGLIASGEDVHKDPFQWIFVDQFWVTFFVELVLKYSHYLLRMASLSSTTRITTTTITSTTTVAARWIKWYVIFQR